MTLEKLEDLSGVAAGTIHAIEARDSSRSSYFPKLAAALGLTVEMLEKFDVRDIREVLAHPLTAREPEAVYRVQMADTPAAAPSMDAIRAWEHPDDLPPGEFVFIPRLDFHLSAGGGLEQIEIEFNEKQPQAFRADWVRREGLKPAKLASMYARGNSMEPSIWDGDSLVVDTSQHDVIDGKVYALWYEGGERVKRLYRLPGGGLRIRSDNFSEHPEIVLGPEHRGDVRIIGRVVHRSGKGGL